MNKQLLVLLPLALVLVLACNTAGQILSPVADDPAAAYGVDRENALYLSASQPRTLDPATTHGGPSGPIGAIFSGLVSLDTDLQVRPEIASGWQIDNEGTRYTFYLNPEARFHDGRPVKAADVIFSWERALRPTTGSDTAATYLGDIVGAQDILGGLGDSLSGARAISDHILEVTIDAPKPYFLSKLTYPAAYLVDRENVSQPDWEHAPNGTGPFKLQEWIDDQILILVRNDNYYYEPAAIAHVVLLMGAGIPLSMYETDEIDLVGIGGSTLERVQDPNNTLFADLRLGTNLCVSYTGFNNQVAPFDDPLVRQAFSIAVDQRKLVDGLYKGNVLPAVGPLPPGMPGYGSVQGYDYDPELARSLLVQAGYGDPSDLPPLTFTTSGYGSVNSLVTALITMWQDNLGVTVEPVLIDPFIYLDELYAGRVGHIFNSGWCADYPDPENFLDVLFHSASRQNLAGFRNPEIDGLLEQARVEVDIEKRLRLYGEIEQRLLEEAPALFLVHGLSAVLVKPYVQGYVDTPIGVSQWHKISLDRSLD